MTKKHPFVNSSGKAQDFFLVSFPRTKIVLKGAHFGNIEAI